MRYLGRNRRFVTAVLSMILAASFGCGGNDPTPPGTDTAEPPPDLPDSSVGTTDTPDPPREISIPDNVPETEYEAATAILKLGGHLDQDSSGHVQAVDLTGTSVSNPDLEQLQAFSKLQGLILTDTEISDEGLEHIAKLPSLMTLELYRTPLTDEGLKYLSQSSTLAGLYLKGTNITDDGLAHIAGLQNLTQLSLSNTKITDQGMQHLAGFIKLESLIIEDTKVTADGIVENLGELKKLELIRAAGTGISREGVSAIQETLPGVRVTGP